MITFRQLPLFVGTLSLAVGISFAQEPGSRTRFAQLPSGVGFQIADGNIQADTDLAKRAEGGDTQAALSLGMRYRDGRGVPRDYKEALKWYRRCADAGDAAGMDNVGFMYLRGWGVPGDFDIAAAYFKAGAGKGDAQALFNLGNCYFSGQGVEQDYSRAIDAWKPGWNSRDAASPPGASDASSTSTF